MRRGRLIEDVSRRGGGTIVPKEVGSDALFALLRATQGEGRENAERYVAKVRSEDLALCVDQTDVKGDRSVGRSQQNDPDLYLRLGQRRSRGADTVGSGSRADDWSPATQFLAGSRYGNGVVEPSEERTTGGRRPDSCST